jgi:hypothetical protein
MVAYAAAADVVFFAAADRRALDCCREEFKFVR